MAALTCLVGCGTAGAGEPGPSVTVIELDADLGGAPCLPASDTTCCPAGFDPIGSHGSAVVCLGSGQ